MIIEEFRIKRKNSNKIDIKIRYKCDICKQIIETHKNNIINKKIHVCKTCTNIKNGKLKRGKTSGKKGKSFKLLQRENSANWNGGRYINSYGYVMILVKSGSINRKSGWENYRPEHIIKMEQKIGRKIFKNECVHHIDGDRINNNIENLVLINSNEHHRKTHMSLQKIGYNLYKSGKIIFDRNINEYKLI